MSSRNRHGDDGSENDAYKDSVNCDRPPESPEKINRPTWSECWQNA
jgi:hypothetical protein